MNMPMTPAEVVQAVADGVGRMIAGGLSPAERERQIDALAALYAEETDVRHPFAPGGGSAPLRTRAELREHFAAGADRLRGVERFAPVRPVVHETGDPEVVVFEFAYAGEVGGSAFEVPNVFVVRVRDGQIVESRDYAHHAALAEALAD
jgi:ketosteroid isomerase-like protein